MKNLMMFMETLLFLEHEKYITIWFWNLYLWNLA